MKKKKVLIAVPSAVVVTLAIVLLVSCNIRRDRDDDPLVDETSPTIEETVPTVELKTDDIKDIEDIEVEQQNVEPQYFEMEDCTIQYSDLGGPADNDGRVGYSGGGGGGGISGVDIETIINQFPGGDDFSGMTAGDDGGSYGDSYGGSYGDSSGSSTSTSTGVVSGTSGGGYSGGGSGGYSTVGGTSGGVSSTGGGSSSAGSVSVGVG